MAAFTAGVEYPDTTGWMGVRRVLPGEIMRVEGLIRWQDPRGGLIAPGEFIPVAEEMGLIEAIGDWVVAEVARQEAIWGAQGIHLEWKDYSGYPEYAQFFPPFEHAVSIVDLIAHTGPQARRYVWAWRERALSPALPQGA